MCTSKKKEEERQAKSVKTPRHQEHSLLCNAEKSRICLDLYSFSGLSEKQRLRASLLPGYSFSCCTSDSGVPRPALPHLCPSRSTHVSPSGTACASGSKILLLSLQSHHEWCSLLHRMNSWAVLRLAKTYCQELTGFLPFSLRKMKFLSHLCRHPWGANLVSFL